MGSKESIKGIILSAGFSSRMGDFKPLMQVKGKTVVENCLDSMLGCGIEHVVLVLGYRGKEIEERLQGKYDSRLSIIYNEEYATTDMFHSVKLGISHLGPCDAFFVLPGDMPDIHKETFFAVRNKWESSGCLIVFPVMDGYRKHPPLIASSCIPSILSYKGEGGLRSIWRLFEDDIATVAVDDIGCETDLDTWDSYARLIARVGKS
ncbi:MAG: nucleotidyltransferase family protein [Sphaerochaetaceae bacterium]